MFITLDLDWYEYELYDSLKQKITETWQNKQRIPKRQSVRRNQTINVYINLKNNSNLRHIRGSDEAKNAHRILVGTSEKEMENDIKLYQGSGLWG